MISKCKHVSVRAQAEILEQVASTSGIPIAGTSKSYVHRVGQRIIQETANKARDRLKDKAGSNKILHYDGKIVKEFTHGKKMKNERIAVSVNIEGDNFLLGIPACESSTGECQSEEIIKLLESYNISEDVIGLVFDTTATNTGRHSGVNTRLNQYLNKEVLHLACRHHVFECHIKNISKLFRITSGPETFFSKHWLIFLMQLNSQSLISKDSSMDKMINLI